MAIRQVHNGQLQYATVQEALAANQWLTSFREKHYALVRPAGSTQSVGALIPSGPEGANGQVTFALHYEADTQPELDAIVSELEVALVTGGVLTAIGDSWDGTTAE